MKQQVNSRKECVITKLIFNFRFSSTVIVNYKVELYDPRSGGFMPSSPGIGMHVEVKDPDDKMVLSRVYSAEGKKSKLDVIKKY